MEPTQPNTLMPDDELQAALAEIEHMPSDQAATIPSLDDGHGDDLAPALPETPQAPAPTSNESVQRPAADAQPEMSAAQIDATLAELATLSKKSKGTPTGQAATTGSSTQPAEPQPTSAPARGAGSPAAGEDAAHTSGSSGAVGPSQTSSGQDVRTGPQSVHFRIGQQTPKEDEATPEPPSARPSAAPIIAPPVASRLKQLYRTADRWLDKANRPFAGLAPSTRDLIGWLALATLIVSILVTVLMPVILPRRDAITFTQEKVSRLKMPPASQEPGQAP